MPNTSHWAYIWHQSHIDVTRRGRQLADHTPSRSVWGTGAPAPSSSAQRRGHASDEALDAQDDLEEEGDDDDSADSESDHEPEK